MQPLNLDYLPVPAFVMDGALHVLAWNRPLLRVLGIDENGMAKSADRSDTSSRIYKKLSTESISVMRTCLSMPESQFVCDFMDVGAESRQFAIHVRSWLTSEGLTRLTAILQDVGSHPSNRDLIQRSEEKYRGIIQNSSLGLLEVDNDEVIQYANRAFCEITGFSKEELLGQKANELLLPKDDSDGYAQMEIVRDQRSSGVANAYEIEIMRKDGSRVWVLISGAPIYDREGKITGSIGIHHDISGQKRESLVRNQLLRELDTRNVALQRQQEHLTVLNRFAAGLLAKNSISEVYRHISDSIRGQMGFVDCIVYHVNHTRQMLEHDPAFMLDVEPGTPGFNPMISVPLGSGITGSAALHGRVERISDTAQDNRYIQDRGIAYDAAGNLQIDLNSDTIRRSELAVPIVYDSTVIGVIDTGHPSVDFFDDLHRDTLVTMAGLTAVKIRQIQYSGFLRDSEQRVRAVIDSSLDAVLTLDSEGVITEATDQALAIFGRPVQELSGMPFNLLLAEEDRFPDWYFRNWSGDATGAGTKSQRVEVGICKPTGEIIQAELSMARVRIQRTPLISVFVRDITIQKQAEIELRTALAREAELNSLKTRFITMTSHEFRTPLTTIQSTAELLFLTLDGLPGLPEERIQKFVRRITTEVDRLTNLMNDILVIGRVESGKISFNPTSVDAVAFLQELLEGKIFVRSDFRKVDVRVSGSPRSIQADSMLLTHILTNLISNALKYSAGKPAPQVDMMFMEDRLRICVRDFGIGIPEADLQRIFDSFFRGSNAENIQGTGLGLVIVKQFVELHGGYLSVSSRLGEGSEFCVDFFYLVPPHQINN